VPYEFHICSFHEEICSSVKDDILIYCKTLVDHVAHLDQVFSVLRDHKLYIKFKKCAFGQHQIKYLGHIISDKGVATDPSKISTMVDWPIPQTFT
jgi:hypothetical protein